MRWVLLLSAVMLAGCGPKPHEVGTTALLGAAAYLAISGLMVRIVSVIWHRIRGLEVAPFEALPSEYVFGLLHVLVSIGAAVSGVHMDAPGFGVLVVGASHLTLSLLLWRLTRARALTAASLASVLCLLPAPLMIYTRSVDAMDVGIVMWLLTGYMGAVPAVVCAGLFIEAIIRRRRDQSQSNEHIAAAFD